MNDPILRTTFSGLVGVPAHTPDLTVRDGIAYVQTHYLRQALPALAEAGPVTLVTHGSDMTADDKTGKPLPSNVKRWFTMNCATNRASALPIGLRIDSYDCPFLADLRRVADTAPGGGRLAYLCATFNNGQLPDYVRSEREGLYRRFAGQHWVTMRGGQTMGDVPFAEFCADLRAHPYVICPRGAGYDSHRFWEALYLGAIPIVRRSPVTERFMGLPALFVHDWSQVTPELLKRRHDGLCALFTRTTHLLTASYWVGRIRNA